MERRQGVLVNQRPGVYARVLTRLRLLSNRSVGLTDVLGRESEPLRDLFDRSGGVDGRIDLSGLLGRLGRRGLLVRSVPCLLRFLSGRSSRLSRSLSADRLESGHGTVPRSKAPYSGSQTVYGEA